MNPQPPPLNPQPEVPKDKPKLAKDWKQPVKWLGGQQLIQSLKWIFIYAVLKRPLDPRRWMNADVISEKTEDFLRAGDGEFWFDYISDSGDGQKAMYNVACLCLSDLYAEGALPVVGSTVGLPSSLSNGVTGEESSVNFKLPRGSFLFVGGDIAYHVADKQTLFEQFQSPFWWAFNDLRDDRLISEGDPRRPIFAVPGNHDYYDSIHGFNRQFRKFHRPTHKGPDTEAGTDLQLKGFKRIQTASYIALRLPFDWWFWALDDENGDLDDRQKQFFIEACPADEPVHQDTFTDGRPNKLIVATPEQTTVYGLWVDKSDKTAEAFRALGLEQPFLNPAAPKKDINEAEYQDINEGKCRLDLSGNVHLYARYWGKAAPGHNASAPVENVEYSESAPEKDYYASVVSGLGGAFHHPSLFSFNEIDERVLFPAKDVARQEVAERIYPWDVWKSGDIRILGAVIAMILFIGATLSPSTRDAFNNFPFWNRLNLSQPGTVGPAVPRELETAEANPQQSAPVLKYFTPYPNHKELPPLYWLGPVSVVISLMAIIISLFYTNAWVKPSAKQPGPSDLADEQERERAENALNTKRRTSVGLILLGCFFFVTGYFGLVRGYYANYYPSYRYETRFGCSIWVLAGLIWSASAIITSILLSGWNAKQKRRDEFISWVTTGLAIFAVVGFGVVLRYFGRYGAAHLLSDLIVMIVILGGLVGIIYFAVSLGGEFYSGGRSVKLLGVPVKGKLLFFVLGFVHYLSQLFIPFLLALRGNMVSLVVVLLIILGFTFWSNYLFKRKWHEALLLSWVVTIALLFLVPLLLQQVSPRKCQGIEIKDGQFESCRELGGQGAISVPCSQCNELAPIVQSPAWLWTPLAQLKPGEPNAIAIGFIGAALSCTLLSWYFIVSLGFKGHYNDAAGAVRIDRFQQIIRFRLREKENDLTGFVIVLDNQQEDDAAQKTAVRNVQIPRATIIDVFQIKPRLKAPGSAA